MDGATRGRIEPVRGDVSWDIHARPGIAYGRKDDSGDVLYEFHNRTDKTVRLKVTQETPCTGQDSSTPPSAS